MMRCGRKFFQAEGQYQYIFSGTVDFQRAGRAKWTALAPARRFGLGNRKGQIKIGCEADFAVVSLNETYTVTNTVCLHSIKKACTKNLFSRAA
ncbi:amidohydrolase family protein [Bacillus haynesii]|uniref:amidohydrolase family protein n=2 Tax=Bacillus haynesii TaxID=1925021 RepID=UPI00228231E2|nr:amidohydrolase family protein [Bacillus haynesii]MCY8016868.1 amidohydrolase family protein [Bacillus haynesii]